MPSIKPLPFGAFRAKVLSLYTPALRAAKTRQKMVSVLNRIARQGARTTADLTTDFFAGWVEARAAEVGPNTILGEIGYARAACAFAHESGWLRTKPLWKKVRPRKAPTANAYALAPADMQRLLDHLAARAPVWSCHRLYAVTALVALTGLRRTEALCARVEDLDLKQGVIRVRPNAHNRLKTTASAAAVPVCDELASVLAAWALTLPEGGEWLRAAAAEVGIERIGFHALRRTWATVALTHWGLPVWVIQRVLRHTSPLTTHLYLSPEEQTIVARVRSISYRPHADGLAA